jgi:hypothetical protein
MDALDYARQDPKFVKREAISAQIAAQNAAVTKQFGQDTFNLYQQYTDLPKDSDARKQFMKDHPEVRGVMAWMYGRSADRDKNSTTPPEFDGGKDYEEAKKRFGDDIWDLYGQYNKDWSKVQKKAFFGQHPEYGNFMDWWYGDDGKGEYTPRHQKVPSGHVRHGQNRGKGKRRGGYWLGQWYIDENGVAHLGGPDGPVGKGPSMGDSSGGDAPQMIGAPENNGPTQSAPQMIGAPENNGPGDVPATLQELQMIAAPAETPTPSRPTQGGAPVGGYWLGNYFIDTQGVAHEGGANGPVARFGKGNSGYRGNQRPAYVDPQSMSSALRVGENDIPQRWRPEWASRGWMNAGQDLAPERLPPMRWR